MQNFMPTHYGQKQFLWCSPETSVLDRSIKGYPKSSNSLNLIGLNGQQYLDNHTIKCRMPDIAGMLYIIMELIPKKLSLI